MSVRTRGALIVLAALGALAVLAPWITPYSHDFLDWQHLAVAPTFADSHWLGTDRLGRDLFARCMQALRISLLIGVASALVSVVIGVSYGAVSGYLGGRTDSVMMRFVDIVYALPYVFIVIILSSIFARGSIAALFFAHYLRGEDIGEALSKSASAIFSVLSKTASAGTPELQIVPAQDELINPSRVFEAQELAR
jgi:ABC-type dipeptide/oligopeptide/nickel transport system permease subunit